MSDDEKMDYLEIDQPIPNQNWVCLSFLSPETLLQSKQEYALQKFFQSYFKNKDIDVDKAMSEYHDFIYKFQDEKFCVLIEHQ